MVKMMKTKEWGCIIYYDVWGALRVHQGSSLCPERDRLTCSVKVALGLAWLVLENSH